MTHYICTGGCNGVSDKPGVCQDEKCPKHGKPLTECGCTDNKHENTEEMKQEPTISFDDFAKVHLKVVKVLEAEPVEGSEKLLKLQVDLGVDPSTSSGRAERQIIAGIGKAYAPENLIGKHIVIVANLASRKLMGLESQGMVLAAGSEDGPVLLVPDKEVSEGSSIS